MSPISDDREFWRAVNQVETAVKAPRRGTTRAELEQVARIYVENSTKNPVDQVRELMGYGSARTAARRVKDAEQAGLLSPTTPGRTRKRAQPSTDAADSPLQSSAQAQWRETGFASLTSEERRALASEYARTDRPDLAYAISSERSSQGGT